MSEFNQDKLKKPINNNAKKSGFEDRSTLDVIHQQQLLKLDQEKKSITSLKEHYNSLKEQFWRSNDDLVRGQLDQQLSKLKDEIQVKQNDERVYDYFLNTGDTLFKYYELQDAISKGDETVRQTVKRKPGDVLSALESAAKTDTIEQESEVQEVSTINSGPKGPSRDMLLHKYLRKINPAYMKKSSDTQDTLGECVDCGEDMIFSVNEAMLYCKACGASEFILIDSDRPSYKDPPRESSYYAYKRINHFNELLAQFQAKGSIEIPEEVYEAIVNELKKQRITDVKNIKQEKIREILRKLRLNKYYDNVPNIINRLNGSNAPVLNRETEEKLRHMFKEIQPSFQKHCPKNRRNFLSYAYVMYKFCELLELDDFLKNFRLLKNRDKLYLQDKTWQLICDDMSWEFIRSI